MNHWLLKTEAEEFSIDDLKRKKREPWSGVRNFQARNNLQSMRKGDLALIYHTGDEKQIVGVGKVVKQAYPEKENPWIQVDIGYVSKVKRPVTLAEVKGDPNLRQMVLAKAPRLSVQPVSEKQFNYILKLASK